jgi:hypothetical protein
MQSRFLGGGKREKKVIRCSRFISVCYNVEPKERLVYQQWARMGTRSRSTILADRWVVPLESNLFVSSRPWLEIRTDHLTLEIWLLQLE